MKPAPFDYRAPTGVDEAVGLLGDAGRDGCVLAGGQSLLIELRYRQRRPMLLVDINRIASLSALRVDADSVYVGALVRHAELEHTRFDDPLAELLHQIARHVAHPPVRTRGTFAGSLAWAHPAAEWNALAVALDAELTLRGPSGERQVSADRWYRGPLRTACRPDELVTGVRLPLLGAGTVVRFAELRRTHGSFPMLAVVVVLHWAHGRIVQARIGLANAAEIPLRAVGAEELLRDGEPSAQLLHQAAETVGAEIDPLPEPYCSVRYRRHAATVLVRRCLAAVVREARSWT